MDQNHDFAALRNLLALKRLEVPMNSEVNRFVIEFHRRQRAQLLVPVSTWARVSAWIEQKVSGISLLSTLSYSSAFAALALVAVVGLGQQVQVSQTASGQYKLSLHMTQPASALAMVSTSLGSSSLSAPKSSDVSFSPSRSDAMTRFVLGNPRVAANDTSVAF